MIVFKNLFNRYLKRNKKNEIPVNCSDKVPISTKLEQNLNLIKTTLGDSSDIITRKFKIGSGQVDALLLNLDGMADQTFVAENVLKPLMLLDYRVYTHFFGKKRVAFVEK